jgi:hypothetical protein
LSEPLDPAGCAIVVAHPDDEALWASSILGRAARVILCFGDVVGNPELSAGRRRAVARLPLDTVESLDIPEAGAFGLAAWPEPTPTPTGLALPARGGPRAAAAATPYAGNHARLVELLRMRLGGFAAVVTHNPWGEYGHEEHVQVFRAVESLRDELGFALWVSGYVSEKSAGLMRRCLGGLGPSTDPLPTDPALGARLQAVYAAEGAWTWFDDYVWPPDEVFHRWEVGPAARRGSVHALNCVHLGWTEPPPPPSPLRRLARRLRAPGRPAL